jgi:hypothetical protein
LGLVMGFRRSERATLVSILRFVVDLVAVCAPIHAEARYSVPLIPFLAILAAIPICRWIEYLRDRRDATPRALYRWWVRDESLPIVGQR